MKNAGIMNGRAYGSASQKNLPLSEMSKRKHEEMVLIMIVKLFRGIITFYNDFGLCTKFVLRL